MSRDYDIPVVRRTFSIRSPRAVLLLNPTVPIVVCILIVSIIFTFWPQTLNHSPISFERRGIVHHIWHYSLLAGSLLALVGMFGTFKRRLEFELFGTIILAGALTMNLIALVADAVDPKAGEPTSGLIMAVRVGVILIFILRVYVLVARPAVNAPLEENRE